jgi:hypothetical protein
MRELRETAWKFRRRNAESGQFDFVGFLPESGLRNPGVSGERFLKSEKYI